MAYAELPDVKARAGRLSSSWSLTTSPGDADIERLLDDVAGQIDVALAEHGIAVPVTDTTATNALRGLNADGALVLLLDSTFPGGSAPAEVATVRNGAEARFNAAMGGFSDGTSTLLRYLIETAGPVGVGASSFWTDEPEYGQFTAGSHVGDDNFRLAPYVARGDRL